jgi:hypothetical protein
MDPRLSQRSAFLHFEVTDGLCRGGMDEIQSRNMRALGSVFAALVQ